MENSTDNVNHIVELKMGGKAFPLKAPKENILIFLLKLCWFPFLSLTGYII